jgi:hypothetical protein
VSNLTTPSLFFIPLPLQGIVDAAKTSEHVREVIGTANVTSQPTKGKTMKTNLDGKSLLIGLLAGAALLATFGATPESPVTNQPVGRFQICCGGIGAGDRRPAAFLVDTITGRVWAAGGDQFLEPKRPDPDKEARR